MWVNKLSKYKNIYSDLDAEKKSKIRGKIYIKPVMYEMGKELYNCSSDFVQILNGCIFKGAYEFRDIYRLTFYHLYPFCWTMTIL